VQIRIRHAAVSFVFILFFAVMLPAQTYDIGMQLSGVHLHKVDETPLIIGVRFHYNFLPNTAVDAEVNHAKENPSGDFGETSVLVGIRAGKRFSRFGVFAKARPGLMYFGGSYFRQRLDDRTHFIVDYGAVLEYYPRPSWFFRIDAGDLVIFYGDARLFNRPQPDALGTVHNFYPGFGFGVRF